MGPRGSRSPNRVPPAGRRALSRHDRGEHRAHARGAVDRRRQGHGTRTGARTRQSLPNGYQTAIGEGGLWPVKRAASEDRDGARGLRQSEIHRDG